MSKSSSSGSLKSDKAEEETKRTFSSSDLVHILPDEERRSFKDIRKILSSPSISSSCSSSQIYRPKSQLSSSSSVINKSIREETQVVEHIYEEILEKDIACNETTTQSNKRPLPPLPPETKTPSSPSSSSPSPTSPIVTTASAGSPVKSIFEGATKYDILHYLEDARERGLTDCDLDECDENDDDDDVVEMAARNDTNRVSNISHNSGSSAESVVRGGKCSVDIERNDSGLGSETSRGASVRKRDLTEEALCHVTGEEALCLDCDAGVGLGQEQGTEHSSV